MTIYNAILRNGVTTLAGLYVGNEATDRVNATKNYVILEEQDPLRLCYVAFSTFAYACSGSLGSHFFPDTEWSLVNTLGELSVQLAFGSAANLAFYWVALRFPRMVRNRGEEFIRVEHQAAPRHQEVSRRQKPEDLRA